MKIYNQPMHSRPNNARSYNKLQEYGKQTRSYTLRTTTVKDSTREERRANCIHQCKECSEQSTKNPTEHPENSKDNQWTEVRSTKRGRNRPDLTTIRKQSKTNYWQVKPMSTHNTFEGLEEVSDETNNNTESIREAKLPPIFISKLNDPSSLRQLLNQIARNEFELKNINIENYKIQIKSSIAYTNIVKELKTRNYKFHTYKSKQERSFKIVLKHMPPEQIIDDIKRDIEDLGHTVTNMWKIKKRGTKEPLNMFCVELKPENNNKDIYQAIHMLGYRVKFILHT